MITYIWFNIVVWLGVLSLTLSSDHPEDEEGKITEWVIRGLSIIMITFGTFSLYRG